MEKTPNKLLQSFLKGDKPLDDLITENTIIKETIVEKSQDINNEIEEEIQNNIIEEEEISNKIIEEEPPSLPIDNSFKEEYDKKLLSLEESFLKTLKENEDNFKNDYKTVIEDIIGIKQDLESLKELIVEAVNRNAKQEIEFKEKLKSVSTSGRKKIILNRDESGKIISAETVDVKGDS